MSRIGNQPIPIPDAVTVTIEDAAVRAKGPKGERVQEVRPEMDVRIEDDEVRVDRPSDAKRDRALHGLTRMLIANTIEGVEKGFSKSLELHGIGYRANKRGGTLVLDVGFSHRVEYEEPDGITITTPEATVVVVEGVDKQLVGQVAAEIRSVRPPEPYKGKGIRYQGEQIRRKAGKAGAAAAGPAA